MTIRPRVPTFFTPALTTVPGLPTRGSVHSTSDRWALASGSGRRVVSCRGLLRQSKGPAFLGRREVIGDSGIPPPAFSIREIGRELDGKSALSVVLRLHPSAVPCVVGKRMGFESAPFPGIAAVPLLIKRQGDDRSVFVIPFPGQHAAVRFRAVRHDERWQDDALLTRRSRTGCNGQSNDGTGDEIPLFAAHT